MSDDGFVPHPSMVALPFEVLYELLDNPHPVDEVTFSHICWWMRPRPVKNLAILPAMVEAGLVQTNSEARRLIEQGGVSWNGQKVTDTRMTLEFIEGRWGVFKTGKNHEVVLNEHSSGG